MIYFYFIFSLDLVIAGRFLVEAQKYLEGDPECLQSR